MTVKHGYQPMRPPQKHVSFDRMAEILSKHTQPKVQAVLVSGGVPRCPAVLEWQKPVITSPGSANQKSVDGRYRIDKIVSQTIVQYTVWRLSEVQGVLHKRLGCVEESPAARALAQTDADAKVGT
jgi:hypothetical protein